MGTIKLHPKVKIFVALTVNDPDRLQELLDDLKPVLGTPDLKSEWFEVGPFTDYYTSEMGPDLKKIFVSFSELSAIENLTQLKISTNAQEDKYRRAGNRRVNIDPGYLTEAKVVLATTKDYSHRLYLSSGIYGDLHLIYRNGSYSAQPWTYPDYQQNLALVFFNRLRLIYKQQITKS